MICPPTFNKPRECQLPQLIGGKNMAECNKDELVVRALVKKIVEDIESAIDEALREAENTTLSKFIRNLESRVFSRLSQDLAESLFDDSGGSGGSIDLEGNTINFVNTGTEIVLTILDVDGVTTEIRIPIGSFGICADEPCVP